MTQVKRYFLWQSVLLLGFSLSWPGLRDSALLVERELGEREETSKHSVQVADAISMTQIGEYMSGAASRQNIGKFSPDGRRFALLLKRGNLANNTNVYSLLLFPTSEALKSPSPTLLVSFSSSSNRPGIREVNWLDNTTITFLGENPGELQELYKINCETKRLEKLTSHSTNLVSYAMSNNGNEIFYAADDQPQPFLNPETEKSGLVVTDQWLTDLISGRDALKAGRQRSLFTKKGEGERVVKMKGAIVEPELSLSPNGKYLLVKTMPMTIPPAWREYNDRLLKVVTEPKYRSGSPSYVYHYELIDTETGESDLLLNAPLGVGRSEVLWAPDSRSAVVSNTFLPLDVSDPVERKIRQSTSVIAEINLSSRSVVPITSDPMRLIKWNPHTQDLLLLPSPYYSLDEAEGSLIAFRQKAMGWERIEPLPSDRLSNEDIQVSLEEDINTPPTIVARHVTTGTKSILLDLNPQFKQLRFGSVRSIEFDAKDGHRVKAGLYLPPDYRAGLKYPLVIQTHGWNPDMFWIDGPYPPFAAQPLAANEIVVAQLDEDLTNLYTPTEITEEVTAYEGVIDYLDGLGLVDRNRVGIIGFSRTGMTVEYALTHSTYHFAAASLVDISDAGYFRYVALLNFPVFAVDSEKLNGGSPFGDGLASWIKNSPGFNLDKVTAPVRMVANRPESALFEWEWFTGLTRLQKPVELLYISDGAHIAVKPWDRMISQQGNVDWFRFWLKGEEDPDPAKAEKYERWRELRRLQELSNGQVHNN